MASCKGYRAGEVSRSYGANGSGAAFQRNARLRGLRGQNYSTVRTERGEVGNSNL